MLRTRSSMSDGLQRRNNNHGLFCNTQWLKCRPDGTIAAKLKYHPDGISLKNLQYRQDGTVAAKL